MKEISADDTAKLLKETPEAVTILDVREKEELATGIIPGAYHLPLSELQARMSELDKRTKYIIVCRSGNRSGVATHLMDSQGYDVINMVGGMLDWQGTLK